MTDSLLPCPFCGSDDIERQSAPWVAGINDETGCYVICSDCGCAIGINPTIDGRGVFSDYLTEIEAIAHWNTRTERTCHNVNGSNLDRFTLKCSECGFGAGWAQTYNGGPMQCNYCPNCGAKVVG